VRTDLAEGSREISTLHTSATAFTLQRILLYAEAILLESQLSLARYKSFTSHIKKLELSAAVIWLNWFSVGTIFSSAL
jgi:hypothetical protein